MAAGRWLQVRRRRLPGLVAWGLLWGLAGCGQPGPRLAAGQTGQVGGTLRLATEPDLRTLDTAIAYDTASWRFIRLIYNGLLDYDDEGRLIPGIAAALPRIDDGRVFTFRLRDDVMFHHGRRVVAADVKYAVERVLAPATLSPASGFFDRLVGAAAFLAGEADEVAGIRCPDQQTLIFELDHPDVSFLNVLAMPFAYPIPRELVEQYTDPSTGESTWPQHAVGCGPYRLVTWERGLRIRVERFEGYFRTDRGYLDAVEQWFGIPEFMQLMMFERGELDVSNIPQPDLERVRTDPALATCYEEAPDNAIYYCSMNCELPPFNDKRVRQAFNYAVDKQRIIALIGGTGVAATGVLPPNMPGFDPDLAGYPHDPDRARALLAEAGHASGLKVELLTRGREREKRWAEAIQQDLAAVGVDCTLRTVSFTIWLPMSGKRGNVPFTVNGWWQDYPDPSNFLDVLLHGDRITDMNCPNRAFYSNPEVNRLLDEAAVETDLEHRLALYRRAEALVVDDAPWIFVYYPNTFRVVQPWVRGYAIHPVWSSTEDRAWLDPDWEGSR